MPLKKTLGTAIAILGLAGSVACNFEQRFRSPLNNG